MKKLFYLFSLTSLIALSCHKNVDHGIGNGVVSTDSTSLHLSNTINSTDSFTVRTNDQFTISVSAGASPWFVMNLTSGRGTTKIMVFTTRANPFDTTRQATITVTGISPDSSQHSIVIPVSQIPLTQEHPNRNAFGGSSEDEIYGMVKAADGGYVAVGMSGSNDGDATGNHGLYDLWLIKVDAQGKKVWQHQYGGSNNDFGYALTTTPEGGFLAVGITQSNDGDVSGAIGGWDGLIVKTDANGNKVWAKTYGTNGHDSIWSVVNTPDAGYIVAGSSMLTGDPNNIYHPNYEFWIFKIDGDGNVVWEKKYGGTRWEEGFWITPGSDGGYVVTGTSLSNDGDVGSNKGGEDVWLGKIDDNGNLLWHQVYGGSGSDYPYYISKTNDGGYLITGYTNSSDSDITHNHGKLDFWVIKTDINGAKVWQKTYGGSNDDIGILGVPSADGTGYIIAGGTGSNDGDLNMNKGSLDGWVFKIDLSGNIVWQKTMGGTGDDTILGIIENSDGSIETAGSSGSPDGDIIGYHGGTGRDGWITRFQHN